MEPTEDFEIDPAIAEAMGFTGFGMQPGKKRKFNANDGVVDDVSSATAGNKEPLGKGKKFPDRPANSSETTTNDGPHTISESSTLHDPAGHQSAGAHVPVASAQGRGKPTIEELKNGVRSENGDVAYFMPSFLEDPWKDLRPT